MTIEKPLWLITFRELLPASSMERTVITLLDPLTWLSRQSQQKNIAILFAMQEPATALVAQRTEQRTSNAQAEGSSPSERASLEG